MWIFRKPSGPHETTIQHNEAKNFRTSANTSMTISAASLPNNPKPRATDDQKRRAIAVAGTQAVIQHNEAKNFRTSANTSMTIGAKTLPKNPMPRATDDQQRRVIAVAGTHETAIQHNEAKNFRTSTNASMTISAETLPKATDDKQRRAIAVALATTAAAEAAVATAQAAVEIIRLTGPSILARKHFAAIAIQTAFRGYLARKALRALKGVVKLQALVRGHNVRRRAKKTLQCMQALVRAQDRVCEQRKRLSYEGSIDSVFSDPNSLWGYHFADKKSMSGDSSCAPYLVDEIQGMPQKTKETARKREKSLSYAISNQMWRSGQNRFRCSEEEQLEEKHRLSDQWMTMKQWEKTSRASSDQREMIKTVEIDTSRPYSYINLNFQRSQNQSYHYHSDSSPLRRTRENLIINSRTTPSPSKTKPLQVHSASPRCPREERDSTKAQTSNLRSVCYDGTGANADSVPNYMNATESAKARARSQSAPRHRSVTPEKEKLFSAKKRLSFPIPDPYNGVGTSEGGYEYYSRSPNCKNRYREHSGMEQRSTTSSVYDYLGDEVSSPSISGGRRWLK
ncbi:hypothetical protein RHSIM_Rhsim03G0214400 [Rhododendron simsii]|uniref:DUF4005 domain-containing protein n=1 Tax=Rhododendron simsii TaxID=118357 RepID=A0A834H8V1_RHOSS|nr:hypothetical protein RHSIM_Rhsim03G0214400 [Rhododendron simsii]